MYALGSCTAWQSWSGQQVPLPISKPRQKYLLSWLLTDVYRPLVLVELPNMVHRESDTLRRRPIFIDCLVNFPHVLEYVLEYHACISRVHVVQMYKILWNLVKSHRPGWVLNVCTGPGPYCVYCYFRYKIRPERHSVKN